MKRYVMSFGASIEHKPQHPERTARKTAANGWDVEFQVWPNRPSMAKSIRVQERNCSVGQASKVWKPCVVLSPGEGF